MMDRGFVNYYEVLGVSRDSSQEEIRNAYRRLAKERHPDRSGGSTEEFARLQEAHDVLSDPDLRRQHDEALDLAHAASQLADLDFSSLEEDELSARRRARESQGPGLGERLKGRFRRKESASRETSSGRRVRGRYEVREARWYEPHEFEPEPITFKSAAISFFAAFLAFIAIGQLGIWASAPESAGALAGLAVLAPFMPVIYTLAGLVAAYLAYRAAGYWAVALVFVAALAVGGQGRPENFTQFTTVGIILLLVAIWLGNRRDRPGR
ncbi:MAG: DnaJ domain-containing protein [Actinomycetota bacterium]